MTEARQKPDDRIGKLLNIPPELVRAERLRWNGETVQRTILSERLKGLITERDLNLRKVSSDDLKCTQGEIAGLLIALDVLTKKET